MIWWKVLKQVLFKFCHFLKNCVQYRILFSEYNLDLVRFIQNNIVWDDDHPDEDVMKQVIRPTQTLRNESPLVYEKEVQEDVSKVINLTDKTKEEVKSLFYNKSFNHIRSVAAFYYQQTGRYIQGALFEKFAMNKFVLVNIVNFAQNETNYYAKCLVRSLKEKRFGNYDENILNCILILRCEVDMADVKQEYYKMVGETLKKSVAKETLGLYENAVCELIGECDS